MAISNPFVRLSCSGGFILADTRLLRGKVIVFPLFLWLIAEIEITVKTQKTMLRLVSHNIKKDMGGGGFRNQQLMKGGRTNRNKVMK